MINELQSKYQRRGVLLDTNLLVVYLVGLLGKRHLKNCRATKTCRPEDFELLFAFLHPFEVLVTTPHVLTETSNLAGRLPTNLHCAFRLLFRELIQRLEEQLKPAKEFTVSADFLKFGLADAAIADIAPNRFLVVTDEVQLYSVLASRGVDVINFNHLRQWSWEGS